MVAAKNVLAVAPPGNGVDQTDNDYYSVSRFRRGIKHFLVGKSLSALLGLSIFMLTVRLMPIGEYGGYMTLLAAAELALAFNSIGLEWVALRYIPEYRTHASGRMLYRLMGRIALLRFGTLLATAAVGAVLVSMFSESIGWSAWKQAAWIYIVFMVIDGFARFMRDVFLETLLLQAWSQISLMIRSIVVCAGLGLSIAAADQLTAAHMGFIETCGSLASLLLSVVVLIRYLAGMRRTVAGNAVWVPPTALQMRQMALHNYAAMLMSQAYSPQVLTLIAGRLAGTEGAAAIGFALRLSDLAKRYLPGTLFVSLLRPTLIAAFAKERDFGKLNRQAALVYKISLFSLFPILLAYVLFGPALIAVIGGGRYQDAYWLVLGLLVVLISRCHRDVLGVVVNSVERMRLWTRASAATLVLFPFVLVFAWSGMGLLGLVVAVMIEEMVSNLIVIAGLRRAGFPYRVDYAAIAKMVGAAGLVYESARWFIPTGATAGSGASIGAIIAGCGFSAGFFLLICYLSKPFHIDERASINRLVKRKLFVW